MLNKCIFCFQVIKNEIVASQRILVDWAMFCREVCWDYMMLHQEQLGGIGKTVEIDESKFGKRKYHRGRKVDGQWVLGFIERESGRVVLQAVETRDKATLLPIIKRWIKPGTTIISDLWKSYDCLKNEGYNHLTVNHSKNFKDPVTGACTNRIESTWRAVKDHYKSSSRRKYFFDGYLAKYAFLKHCRLNSLDPFEEFMKHTAVLYSPFATAQSSPLVSSPPADSESSLPAEIEIDEDDEVQSDKEEDDDDDDFII
jgi:transposase-like protein